LFWLRTLGEVHQVETMRRDVLENVRQVLPHLQRVWIREIGVATVVDGRGADESLAIRCLQRFQHDGVDDREHCRVRRDPDAERENDDRGEAAIPGKGSQRVAEVALDVVEPPDAASISVDFLHLFDATEVSTRRGPRRVRREAFTCVLCGEQIQMRLDVLLQVRIRVTASDQP
jgi:hypothetical protein